MEGKIALTLMFDGTAFHGWQVQKNAVTVQSTLQDALFQILGFRPDVTGCSRTDAGVHANMFVCHLSRESITLSPHELKRALNTYLPDSVSVTNAEEKPSDFHARYSCREKEYIYKIWNADYKNPFLNGKALFYPIRICENQPVFFEKELVGTHDFCSFMAKGSKIENTVRTVKYFKTEQDGALLTISICADGFLYNMVRIIVGTYLFACAGKIGEGGVSEIIEKKDRSLAGPTVPACGLYLNRVIYE